MSGFKHEVRYTIPVERTVYIPEDVMERLDSDEDIADWIFNEHDAECMTADEIKITSIN